MHNLVYNSNDGVRVLSLLDGWELQTTTDSDDDDDDDSVSVTPFMSDTETVTSNKKVTSAEIETFFDNAVVKALTYINKLNIDNFSSTETSFFRTAVYYWTASDLWNKYNIRVNNEDMEDTYVQSYGSLLYNQGKNILDKFNQSSITMINRSTGLETELDKDWII